MKNLEHFSPKYSPDDRIEENIEITTEEIADTPIEIHYDKKLPEQGEKLEQYKVPDFIFNIGELGILQTVEKDEQKLWDFAKLSSGEAFKKNAKGQQINVVEQSLDEYEQKFGPNKLKQIKEDSQKWVEQLAKNLRELDKNSENDETQRLIEKIETDSNFRLWLSEQYQLKRLTEMIKTKKIESGDDFTDDEKSRITKSMTEEVEKKRPEDLWGSGIIKKEDTERILKKLKSDIENGELNFEGLDEPSRKIYNELREQAEKKERMRNPFKEIERRLSKAHNQLLAEGLQEDANNLQEVIARVKNKNFFNENKSDILLWEHGNSSPTEKSNWEKLTDKFKNFFVKNRSHNQYNNPFRLPPEAQITSWVPSEKAREIIIKSIGGLDIEKNPGSRSTSMGKTDIEYWTDEFFTANVEFYVTEQEGYSMAYVSIWPPPFDKK